MEKKQLILVRHGTTDFSDRRLMIGRSDPELNEKGRRDAENLASLFRHRPAQRLYCSPKTRCRQSADVIGSGLGLTAEVDDNLREVDFGDWENKSFNEIQRQYPDAVDRWVEDFMGFRFPGGESTGELHGRVVDFLDKIFAKPSSPVVCITHGGVIGTMICRLLNLSPESYLAFKVLPAGIVTFEIIGGTGVLVELNNSISRE